MLLHRRDAKGCLERHFTIVPTVFQVGKNWPNWIFFPALCKEDSRKGAKNQKLVLEQQINGIGLTKSD